MSPPSYLRRLGAPLITYKLADPADNAPGHVSDRLGVTAPRAESAPSVFTHPPRTDGALSDQSFAHAAITISQEQHNHG